MSRIYLACESSEKDHPYARRDFERLVRFAGFDVHGRHCLVDQAKDADLVVFAGSVKANFSDITKSALYASHRERSVIFYSGDRAVPLLPGLYTCLENSVFGVPAHALAGYYLRVSENESMDIEQAIEEADFLYSFLGNANNHPVRKAICRLSTRRGYIRDSSADSRQQDDGVTGANEQRGLLYRDVVARSKFVLCPRGLGVSSWRLFETMRAGRVPVVISDAWVRPYGPDWNSFCIFVRESEVAQIPSLLEAKEGLAVAYGQRARLEWERWYALPNVFNTIIDDLLLANVRAHESNRFASILATYGQYADPYFLKYWIGSPALQFVRLKLSRLGR